MEKKISVIVFLMVTFLTVTLLIADHPAGTEELDECAMYIALKDAKNVFGGHVPERCS